MNPNENATVLARGTTFRGDISGTTNLLIDGDLNGKINLSTASVTVRAEGHVQATIVAQDIIIIGHVEGELRATNRVELRNGAVVLGNIFATRLSIEDGATLRGSFDPSKATDSSPK